MIYLVTIQDKTLHSAPDIALAVVEAPNEDEALGVARATIDVLAEVEADAVFRKHGSQEALEGADRSALRPLPG